MKTYSAVNVAFNLGVSNSVSEQITPLLIR